MASAENCEYIWLDVDTGHDDALALILAAHASERVKVLGVSTVFGNQTVEKTTRNSCRILYAAGVAQIEIFRGAEQPLCAQKVLCPEIHGETGLDGTSLLPMDVPLKESAGKAILVMAERILACDKPVSLVATACLTNVALLLTVFPEVKRKLRQISFLGGSVGNPMGNIGPVAEFNVLGDPDAAHIVFSSGVEVVMHGLNVTHGVLVTPDVFSRIRQDVKGVFGQMCIELLSFYRSTYSDVFQMEDPPLHDPVAVAWVLDPTRFVYERLNVCIERSSPLSLGQTVCDVHRLTGKAPNAVVTKSVDVEWFWDIMIDALSKASGISPLNRPS